MAVATRLNKLPRELEDLTPDELAEIVAYFKLQREAEKKAHDAAVAKAKHNARRGGHQRR